ncbi:hypothetical protein QM787_09470 [Rhodococcus ruber]|uniref:hypothetical protein n=1 Tax=Rhodococcus TaxID=1827 RepID=UPI0012F6FE91|nr:MULTISPECIES: hypothetical protein [Rhodococcus]MDO2377681.1 hypothetical protein [Rhodococcus ruber]MBD8055230.1 hypothetical protein [Rhodococcus ruber]MBP2211350.1 hypothetical protein [Rhodococcus ruber]MCD2126239.1 hypothetical protein [Rhodococcus ruber]MCF8783073.1 hypothetical protein [Rhodococcus ruber]
MRDERRLGTVPRCVLVDVPACDDLVAPSGRADGIGTSGCPAAGPILAVRRVREPGVAV